MTINSYDAAIAGALPAIPLLKVGSTMEAAGVLHSFLYASGAPGAAVAPSPGINGAALTSYAGQIPFTNPGSGETRLMRLSGSASQPGKLLLLDRLWHNSGVAVTTTTEQAITTPTWPARDINASTNGNGVLIGIEVSSATTNAGAITNTTLNYTDSDGNASATGTIASFPATAAAGTFVPFQLAAGDKGVRSIQGITLGTSYGGGAIHLVAYRVLAELELPSANVGAAIDLLTGGAVKLLDNTVPFLLFMPTSTTAATFTGALTLTQG